MSECLSGVYGGCKHWEQTHTQCDVCQKSDGAIYAEVSRRDEEKMIKNAILVLSSRGYIIRTKEEDEQMLIWAAKFGFERGKPK